MKRRVIKVVKSLLSQSKPKLNNNFASDESLLRYFKTSPRFQKVGSQTDIFGTVELAEYLPEHHVFASPGEIIPANIPINEEYFEWMDILNSIVKSEEYFTFVELGAGYGRWSARAYMAALSFGIKPEKITLITVEADPKHSQWCKKHLNYNGVDSKQHLHFQSAISNYCGETDFFVQKPDFTREESEKNWYGQAIAKSGWEGAKTERVGVITLEQIFESIPNLIIDLIDSDLQGEDWAVLSHNPNLLSRVKRVHIGTDSEIEEKRLRKLFNGLGWTKILDYPGRGERTTYVGTVSFVDGVQTWINPKYE